MYLINKKQKLTECDKLLYIIIEHIFEFFKRIIKKERALRCALSYSSLVIPYSYGFSPVKNSMLRSIESTDVPQSAPRLR